jgi:DNA-binding CsgD family transcriptional regulator
VKLSDRDDELQLLDRLNDGCVRGRGAAVLVNGPVGCGKTALLQAFAERTADQGGLFLPVTASTSERLHLFGLIDQLVNAMRAAGLSADPFAAEDVGVTVSGHEPEGIRRAPLGLLQRICRTVCEFAEVQPLVISVDDVHFADEFSLQCLRYLIRRIDSSRVVITMTESSCYERELATLHAETLHLPYCHRIRLAPLTVGGVADQLAETLGGAPARETAAAWADASGGNPLLLHALIEDSKRERTTPEQTAPPGVAQGAHEPGESFRHAFLRCLHRCEPAMLAVARAAAVLCDTATPLLIADLLGGDVTSVRRSIADLNAAGLLTAGSFRHEQEQLAVLADISVRALSDMHGRAAELLHESGASARAVADQLMSAQDSVKAPWRVDILREAARAAMADGGVTGAVDYLRHASGVCTDAVQEAEVTAELADAQWYIDPTTTARHLPRLSHLVRAGLLTGEAAMVPFRQLLWRGEFPQAEALLQLIEGGPGQGDAGASPGAAPSGVSMAGLWLSFCSTGPARGDVAGRTGQVPGVPSDGSGGMPACTFLDASANPTGDGEAQSTDQALHGGRTSSPLVSTLFALISLIQRCRFDEAALRSEQLLEEDWIRHVPMRRAQFETIRSAAALRRGSVADAEESAQRALRLVTPSGWGVVVGLPLSLAIRAATEAGDFEAATAALNVPVPPAMFETPFALPYIQAVGHYHLAMGRPLAALTNFQECGDLMVKWALDHTELADWRNDAAASLIALGQTRQARTLVEEQLSRLGCAASRSRGIALRRLAATSDTTDRLPLLQEAIRILVECGDRLELAHAQVDLQAALDVLDRQTRPARPWTFRTEEDDGRRPPGRPAPAASRNSEPGPAEGGDRDRALAGLTEAEHRVAALAASGSTNREIAGKLFITVSTVEQHLTRIYRKLKVRRRSELPSGLLEGGDLSCFPNV